MDPAELADGLRVTAAGLADALGVLAAVVDRADGEHVDLGAGTADKRVTAREVARAADGARTALGDLDAALATFTKAWADG